MLAAMQAARQDLAFIVHILKRHEHQRASLKCLPTAQDGNGASRGLHLSRSG